MKHLVFSVRSACTAVYSYDRSVLSLHTLVTGGSIFFPEDPEEGLLKLVYQEVPNGHAKMESNKQL